MDADRSPSGLGSGGKCPQFLPEEPPKGARGTWQGLGLGLGAGAGAARTGERGPDLGSGARPPCPRTPRPAPAPAAAAPHLRARRRLLGHHEATSPLDAVVLVLLGAAREVAPPLRPRGGSCQVRKGAVSALASRTPVGREPVPLCAEVFLLNRLQLLGSPSLRAGIQARLAWSPDSSRDRVLGILVGMLHILIKIYVQPGSQKPWLCLKGKA